MNDVKNLGTESLPLRAMKLCLSRCSMDSLEPADVTVFLLFRQTGPGLAWCLKDFYKLCIPLVKNANDAGWLFPSLCELAHYRHCSLHRAGQEQSLASVLQKGWVPPLHCSHACRAARAELLSEGAPSFLNVRKTPQLWIHGFPIFWGERVISTHFQQPLGLRSPETSKQSQVTTVVSAMSPSSLTRGCVSAV